MHINNHFKENNVQSFIQQRRITMTSADFLALLAARISPGKSAFFLRCLPYLRRECSPFGVSDIAMM